MPFVLRVAKVVGIALLSVGLHLAVGWESTVLAGVVGGAWADRSGWIVGAVGTAAGWTALVFYSAFAAPDAFRLLHDLVGAFAGTIPGEALVGAMVFLGAVLGALGGGMGMTLRSLLIPSVSTSRNGRTDG